MTIFNFNIYKFNKFEHFCRIFSEINYQNTLFFNVFISDELNNNSIRKEISTLFNSISYNLNLTIIPQPLLDSAIAMELISLNEESSSKRINTNNSQIIKKKTESYTVTTFTIDYRDEESFLDSTQNCFKEFNKIIVSNKGELGKLTRQWNYLGNINCSDTSYSNYNIFNNQRFHSYSQAFINDYPAATGIGANSTGMMIQGFYIDSRFLSSISIENPNQVPAYNYSDTVLNSKKNNRALPPLFCRARLLLMKNIPTEILISGTASISGENTVSEQDIKLQTTQTIENIKILISADNLTNHLKNHLIENKITIAELSHLRVYIKNPAHYPIVKEIVQNELFDISAIYLQADVCRNNLLVEIEGYASLTN
jgi:hypothetical protein